MLLSATYTGHVLTFRTSNRLLLSFFVHGFPSLKGSDFLACFIIEISSFVIIAKLEAQDNAWSS